jgi:hypothetical protein
VSTMRVSRFVTDATACSGRIQRALGEQGVAVENIMDNLALVDAYAVQSGKVEDQEFDIVRLGVEPDNRLRVEVQRRWTRARIITLIFRVLGILALLVAVGGFAYGMGYDEGRTSGWSDVQLPTLGGQE